MAKKVTKVKSITPKSNRFAKTKRSEKECPSCESTGDDGHPDHKSNLPSLRRAEGQLRGISEMIENKRYCVDILIQMRAAVAALRSIEMEIFETHVRSCVKDALGGTDSKQSEAKLNELVKLMLKRT